MKLYTGIQQLTPEWHELHRGRPTAGGFDRIITAKTMKIAAAADDYINELIAQQFHNGDIGEAFFRAPSKAMQNGIDTESEARAFYEMELDYTVERVGFCTTDDDRFGCSPDGLIRLADVPVGALELKCPTGKVHVGYLRDGGLPPEYRAQVHGELLITGAQWVDFVSYCPGLPPLIVRVTRDNFTDALAGCLELFWAKYQATLALVREM